MLRMLVLLVLPAAAAAQTPPVPNLDAARAVAREVDQATKAPRIGKESMDRVTPLLVEPQAAPDDDPAGGREKEEAPKKMDETTKPQ